MSDILDNLSITTGGTYDVIEESLIVAQPPAAKKAKKTSEAKMKYTESNCPFDLGLLVAKDIERVKTEIYIPQPGDDLPVGVGCEVSVAKSITWDGVEYELDLFKATLLRSIAYRIKATIARSASKLKCRIAIAEQCQINNHHKLTGIHPEIVEMQNRNTVLRVVNVVFSDAFYPRLVQINDKKDRSDMETKNMVSNFWSDAVIFYNKSGEKTLGESINFGNLIRDSAEEDNDPLEGESDPNELMKRSLVTLDRSEALKLRLEKLKPDLKAAHRLTAESFRKKIFLLMKLRRHMNKDMSSSGTGSDDPDEYVQNAMRVVKNGGSLNRDAIVYFFCRTEEKGGELDSVFQVEMNDTIKGSSEYIGEDHRKTQARESSVEKKQKQNAFAAMIEVSKVLLLDHEHNKTVHNDNKMDTDRLLALEEKKAVATERMLELEAAKEAANTLASERKFALDVAIALGDQDAIRKLLKKFLPAGED